MPATSATASATNAAATSERRTTRLDPAEALERAPQVEHAAGAAGLERDGDLRLRPARFAAQPRDEAVLP